MKKFLFTSMALSALMLASCANEDLNGPAQDGPVVFSVQLPGEFTRAISDGSTATQLSYAVYLKGENNVLFTSENTGDPQAEAFSGLKTSLSLNLAKGKEYDIIFWADKPGNSFYDFKPATKSVEITYDGIVSNDEDRDAFFQKETFKVTGAETRTVILRRPFAQLNFATSDLEAANKAGLDFSKTQVTVSNVYNTLNLLTGVASNAATGDNAVTFAWNGLVNNDVVNGTTDTSKKYNWLSMNYLLTGAVPGTDIQTADSETVNCTFKVQDSNANEINTIEISNVPVQRNYRTNIYGALLTSTVDFNIEIEPTYNDPAHKGEYDEEGFRVANSLVEAKALLKDGEPAVSVLASLLTATRAAGDVEFLLNKTVPWQKLKVKGEATTGVKVSYDAVAEGSTAVDKPKFTLIITNKVPSATFDLPDAAVEIKGKPEPGAEAAEVTTVTVDNAASATVSGDTKVEEITTGDSFTGDVEFNDNVELTVNTAELFTKALTDEGVKTINVTEDLDLTSLTTEQLTINSAKIINISEGKTATLGNKAHFEVYGDLTIQGKGKITNDNGDNSDLITGGVDSKNLFIVYKGNFVVDGAILVNDLNWHYHSTTQNLNAGAILYYNDANLTIKNNARILSGEFAVCGMFTCTGNLTFDNCYIESTSSNINNGQHWAYAMRLRGNIVLNDTEVKGIQGGISFEHANTKAVINSGKYYTVNNEGKNDAFYAIYMTNNAKLTINGGEFSGPNNRAPHILKDGDGTSCVVSGDNDVNLPTGSIIINGGKFSGKPYNHVTNAIYTPEAGKSYVSISEDPYIFEVK